MDMELWSVMKDSAVTGDGLFYFGTDNIKDMQRLDNTSILYGDENNKKIQQQPYLIIHQRLALGVVREIARKNNVPEEEIASIVPDQETSYTVRELVLRVQNLERLRQVGQLVVRTQEAVTQAMEGADPHAPHVQWKHGRQPRHHLFRGLVGEGHGQNAARRNLPGLQQPGNARGQHPCLARAGTCQNQGVLRGQSDGAALFRVEIV